MTKDIQSSGFWMCKIVSSWFMANCNLSYFICRHQLSGTSLNSWKKFENYWWVEQKSLFRVYPVEWAVRSDKNDTASDLRLRQATYDLWLTTSDMSHVALESTGVLIEYNQNFQRLQRIIYKYLIRIVNLPEFCFHGVRYHQNHISDTY